MVGGLTLAYLKKALTLYSMAIKTLIPEAHAAQRLDYVDPYVPVIKPTREYLQFAGKKSVDWERAVVEDFDPALIATSRACVNCKELGEWSRLIVNTRNAMGEAQTPPRKVRKA